MECPEVEAWAGRNPDEGGQAGSRPPGGQPCAQQVDGYAQHVLRAVNGLTYLNPGILTIPIDG